MNSLVIKSPAKINLYLKILGKRRDGYHDLLTLFHRISLCDILTLKKLPAGKFNLTCSNPSLEVDEHNLITRAYRALQKRFPKLGGVSVRLKKNIPIGAGLGGGSSNAAAFLLGIKRLYGLSIRQSDLMKLGGALGADVPFFLLSTNQAIGYKRGDKLKALPAKRKQWFILVVDSKGLSTKSVYQNMPHLPAVSLTKERSAVKLLHTFLEKGKGSGIKKFLHNDLEISAFQLRPSLSKVIALLENRGFCARMSGSGPTIFTILSHQKQAKQLNQFLRKFYPSKRILICHTF